MSSQDLSQETQKAFNDLFGNLGGITENGNFTKLQDHVDLQFGSSDNTDLNATTEVHMQRYVVQQAVSGFNPLTMPSTSAQGQQTAMPMVVLPDSASAMHAPSPYPQSYSPAPQALNTQANSLPSNTEWPGENGFEVVFGKQPKETKSTTWTYSPTLKKLFANLESLCPIMFKCNSSPPPGCAIRILPIYVQHEDVQKPVTRCPNHIQRDNGSHMFKSHLIRCQNPNTIYHTDPNSGRESLTIPFEEPQAGSDTFQSLFQFMCYSSCVGGLNRRPLQVIFTLETPLGEVIGRRVVEVRICACPGRDRKTEEDQATRGHTGPKKTKKTKQVHLTQHITTVAPPAAKKRKLEDEEVFTIHVRGRENYEVLLRMRDALELAQKAPVAEVAKHQQDYEEINKRMTLSNQVSIPVAGPSSQNDAPAMDRLPTLPSFSNWPSIPSFGLSQFFDEIDGKPPNQLVKGESIKKEPGATASPVVEKVAYQMSPRVDEVSSSQSPSTTTDMEAGDQSRQRDSPISSTQPMQNTVESWLQHIGMSGYVDLFHQHGFRYMFQLDEMQLPDLEKLKIGDGHRSKIWNSLVQFKHHGDLRGSQRSQSIGSNASTITIPSQTSGFNPGFYEVTKYTFKHTFTLTKDDHNYATRGQQPPDAEDDDSTDTASVSSAEKDNNSASGGTGHRTHKRRK